MIPNTKDRELQKSGVEDSALFGLSINDSAHIMSILREQIYSDKVLAVLREYGANAWDANREAGKEDKPIKVTLPTLSSPTLSIRDYGFGLSKEDIFEIYTQYGASTKRGSNTAVGMLGIGSKSGFAYSDSFNIISYHNGKKCIYVALLDETEKGTINLLVEEISNEETGIEIQIPVKSQDIREFEVKAQNLFRHFSPLPIINTTIASLPTRSTALTHGVIYASLNPSRHGYASWYNLADPYSVEGWVALMGCVPYRINLDQLQGVNVEESIPGYIKRLSGLLKFSIGEIQISASREELKYSAQTKKALVKKFNALIEEFVNETLKKLDSDSVSLWEKRLNASIFGELKLPVPPQYRELTKSTLELKPEPKKSFLTNLYKTQVRNLNINSQSRFILEDDPRDPKGFNLSYSDTIVSALPGHTMQEAEEELLSLHKEWGIQGAPILKLSTMPFNTPWVRPNRIKKPKQANKKHQVKTFKLNHTGNYVSSPYSQYWDIVTREPTDKDVYVRIDGFKTIGFSLYNDLIMLRTLAASTNRTIPDIYGYKPGANVTGIPYLEWRRKFIREITSEYSEFIRPHMWDNVCPQFKYSTRATLTLCISHLGASHPITRLINKIINSAEILAKNRKLPETAICNMLLAIFQSSNKTLRVDLGFRVAENYAVSLVKKYPLFFEGGRFDKQWFDYIKSMDKIQGR